MSNIRYALYDTDECQFITMFCDSLQELENELNEPGAYESETLVSDLIEVVKVEFLTDMKVVNKTTISKKQPKKK